MFSASLKKVKDVKKVFPTKITIKKTTNIELDQFYIFNFSERILVKMFEITQNSRFFNTPYDLVQEKNLPLLKRSFFSTTKTKKEKMEKQINLLF